VLQPLCASASFRTFNLIFKAILALSFSGLIWFAGRAWTTRFFHPGWILLLAIGCLRFDPLRDAMTMTQTHGIFLLATVFAILLARNGHPLWAGLLLSLAASVKITPAAMVFYWMVTSHWRATLSFLASMAAWTAITFAAVGRATMDAYLHSISRVSNVLLLSGNNQSFAAWWMARFYPASEAQVYHSYPLPLQLKLLCGALVLGSALLGGLCDRRLRVAEPGAPPYGAVIALLGATIFTPIAWSHYSIVLVLPIMLLLDRALRWRSAALMVGAGIVFLLADCNLLSRQLTHWRLPTGWLLRGQFLACGLAMAALLLLVGRLLWKNPEQSGQRAQMPSAA
jgi:hypothetical protein